MAKYFAELFVLAAAISLSIAGSNRISVNKDYIHLGSFENPITHDEADYYIDPIPKPYDEAYILCNAFPFTGGSLVIVETEPEWEELKRLLAPHGYGEYWMGGYFDTRDATWKWEDGTPFPPAPWAPWITVTPPVGNGVSRATALYQNLRSAFWTSKFNTELKGHICEVPRSEPEPCYKTNDLAIVLDGSGSVGADNFEISKTFVAKLAGAFNVKDESRLSFITFSTQASVIFSLNNILSSTQMNSTIWSTVYPGGNTATGAAIAAAVQQFTSYPRDFPRNMVVITDGQSNDPQATLVAAESARALGVKIYTVGITDNVNQNELLGIVGGDPSRIYNADTFDKLVQILRPLSRAICAQM